MRPIRETNVPSSGGRSKTAPTIKKASTIKFTILRAFIRPALYLLYRFRFEMKTSKGIERPCLILCNHQASFDQFTVSMGFKFGINYVGSDTLFRQGLKSRLMVWLTSPIPFSKGNSDLIALKNMMAVIKSGGCVGMFPSGNRSFYGDECRIVPGIGKLAKKFNVPLVLVQMRGGFNTLARWRRSRNVGKVTAFVSKVVGVEELNSLSAAEVDTIIQKELSFDEFEWNRTAKVQFHGRRKAEYLESVLFVCPECGSMGENEKGLRSNGNEFFCQNCRAKVVINSTGFFEKVHNAQKIPDTILEWSRIQIEHVKNFDFSPYTDKPVFTDDNVTLSRAERAKKEHLLGSGSIEFYNDRILVCEKEFPLVDITSAIQGVQKFTVYHEDSVYAVLAPHRTNLIKYMICAYHLKNKALGITEEYYGY